MGNVETDDSTSTTDESGERNLRGTVLNGSEKKAAIDHESYSKKRNTDGVLRLDGEKDTLYDDSLEVGDDPPPLGTSSNYDKPAG